MTVDYPDDSSIIPRNTSVVVKRVPIPKGSRPRQQQTGSSNYVAPTLSAAAQKITSVAVTSGQKEEDARIQRMVAETSSQWTHSQAMMAE